MPRAALGTENGKIFHVTISNLPLELANLPEAQQWQLVKDRLRGIGHEEAVWILEHHKQFSPWLDRFSKERRWQGIRHDLNDTTKVSRKRAVQDARKQSDITREAITEEWIREIMIDQIMEVLGMAKLPKNDVSKGVAFLEAMTADEAFRKFDFIHKRQWDGYVLEARIQQNMGHGKFERIWGPPDNIHHRSGYNVAPRPDGSASGYTVAGVSESFPNRISELAAVHGEPVCRIRHDFTTLLPQYSTNTCGWPQQTATRLPLSPTLSTSSRNSSVSSISAAISSYEAYGALPTVRAVPNRSGPRFTSSKIHLPNKSTTSRPSRGNPHPPTPPSSMAEYPLLSPVSASKPRRYYKVTIMNMSPEATKERIGELVEERTRAFVPLVQPDPIKLRSRQLHAFVKFTQRHDAVKAKEGLHGLKFMGRSLQAVLDDIDEQ